MTQNSRCALGLIGVLAVSVLAGCTTSPATPDDSFAIAWENCTEAYQELPHSIDTLAKQNPGTEVSAETPCNNWIDSQGKEEFDDFWSNPAEFMAYVVSAGKLEALGDL